eukprot:PhF_6_TR5589/c0_g1_i2/m.8025
MAARCPESVVEAPCCNVGVVDMCCDSCLVLTVCAVVDAGATCRWGNCVGLLVGGVVIGLCIGLYFLVITCSCLPGYIGVPCGVIICVLGYAYFKTKQSREGKKPSDTHKELEERLHSGGNEAKPAQVPGLGRRSSFIGAPPAPQIEMNNKNPSQNDYHETLKTFKFGDGASNVSPTKEEDRTTMSRRKSFTMQDASLHGLGDRKKSFGKKEFPPPPQQQSGGGPSSSRRGSVQQSQQNMEDVTVPTGGLERQKSFTGSDASGMRRRSFGLDAEKIFDRSKADEPLQRRKSFVKEHSDSDDEEFGASKVKGLRTNRGAGNDPDRKAFVVIDDADSLPSHHRQHRASHRSQYSKTQGDVLDIDEVLPHSSTSSRRSSGVGREGGGPLGEENRRRSFGRTSSGLGAVRDYPSASPHFAEFPL